MKLASDTATKSRRYRPFHSGKAQPLSRAHLDGRTLAARTFDRVISGIEADLGGRQALTTVEAALAEAFAGAVVTVGDLNTRLLMGQAIDLNAHCAAISSLVRIASRLGISRRARDVTPSLANYLQDKQQTNTDYLDIKQTDADVTETVDP